MSRIIALFVFVFLITFSLKAEEKSVYGLGISVLSAPAYIGSNKQNLYVVPFPYIEYRGKYFNIDKDKIYNELYNTEKTKVEISLRGMLPVDSRNTAREGMPDLDAIIEIGPKIIYNLFSKDDMKIDLELPIRANFSIGDSLFDYQGYFSSFDLKYENSIFDNYKISFISGLGYSNKKINNYYYEVESKYVNENRREYHSSSGYSDFHNSLSITKKDKSFWYGGFIKHYYIDGAVYKESPLVETDNALFLGIASSYLF